MIENIIKIENLNFSFGKDDFALKNVEFSIKKGSFHGFVGSNGAGKTTIIRTIIGLYPNYKGSIKINDNEIKTNKHKFLVGYVPETAQFYATISVKSYLNEFAQLSNISKDKLQQILANFEPILKLKEIEKRKAASLSSGQKKRVLLAQALICDPKILILDEPAANLDPKARDELFNILKKLVNENNLTVFISSHILDELNKYIDSVTIIEKGQIRFTGPLTQEKESITWNINTNDNSKAYSLIKKTYKAQVLKDKITVSCELDKLQKIIQLLIKNKISIFEISQIKQNLVDLYFNKVDSKGAQNV